MKLLVLILCVGFSSAALVTSRPLEPNPPQSSANSNLPVAKSLTYTKYEHESDAPVLRSEFVNTPDSFNYAYETGNGISGQAVGHLKRVNDIDVMTMEGQYEYPGDNGETILVAYTADEDGYHPRSDILPTSPPVPDYVVRLVKYLEEHAPQPRSE